MSPKKATLGIIYFVCTAAVRYSEHWCSDWNTVANHTGTLHVVWWLIACQLEFSLHLQRRHVPLPVLPRPQSVGDHQELWWYWRFLAQPGSRWRHSVKRHHRLHWRHWQLPGVALRNQLNTKLKNFLILTFMTPAPLVLLLRYLVSWIGDIAPLFCKPTSSLLLLMSGQCQDCIPPHCTAIAS